MYVFFVKVRKSAWFYIKQKLKILEGPWESKRRFHPNKNAYISPYTVLAEEEEEGGNGKGRHAWNS